MALLVQVRKEVMLRLPYLLLLARSSTRDRTSRVKEIISTIAAEKAQYNTKSTENAKAEKDFVEKF